IDRVETFLENIDGAMASGGSGSATVRSVSLAEADSSELRIHRVRRGDTLYGIARRYGVTVAAIKQANGLRSNKIMPGTRLEIP
ncbi:MAG: LysM peptidoglycan-binding domain-containing protein, partial [Gemmatimonadetes bacterium]|nr:LysM peptidoglycan-binding domain-containing protein [Gemmatimonadota bacterium]